MNMVSSAWLPPEALAGGAVERAVAETVAAWSEKWFARRLVRPVGSGLPSASPPAGQHLLYLDAGLGVAFEPSARLALAGMLLNCPIPRVLTPADQDLLEGLAGGCLEDLCREAGACFGLAQTAPLHSAACDGALFRDSTSFALGPSEAEPLLRLLVDRELAVRLVKSRAVQGAKPIALRPLAAGLALQKIAVGALAGRCEISLADLAGLQAGDVLLLDRTLEEPLDLAIDGQLQTGRCSAEEEAGRLHLKILTSLSG